MEKPLTAVTATELITKLEKELIKVIEENSIQFDQIDKFVSGLTGYGYPGIDLTTSIEFYKELHGRMKKANKLNAISDRLIYDQILFGLIAKLLYYPKDRQVILEEIPQKIEALAQYRPTWEIDIPVINLELARDKFEFANVHLTKITNRDREVTNHNLWWESIQSKYGKSIAEFSCVSYARIICQTDMDTSLEAAQDYLNQVLLIIRAIGFPWETKYQIQIGSFGEFDYYEARPHRLNKASANYKLEPNNSFVFYPTHGTRPYNLETELLNAIKQSTLATVIASYAHEISGKSTDMEKKLLSGLRWIGEATKPDTTNSRYVKLAIAMEILLGGEKAGSEFITFKGLSAMYEERAAHLMGNEIKGKLEIASKVRSYYKARSDVVHNNFNISPQQLIEFGNFMRQLSLIIVEKLEDFPSLESYYAWFTNRRYSASH